MKRQPWVAALLALLMVAGACSRPSADEAVPAPGDEAPEELAFSDDAADQDAALPALRLAAVKPESLDTALVNMADQNTVLLVDLLYDGLTEASAAGVLRPGLALDWKANADFTEWTFELDLDRVTADEVIDSFDRLREQGDASVAARLLDGVVSIQEQGADEVVFELRNPHAGLPWILSGVPYSVALEGRTTGVYEVVEESEEGLSLAAEGRRPIEIVWGEDGYDTYERLTLAQVDAAVVDPALSRDAAHRFGQPISARSIVRFYGLNLSSENLWDPRVREAVLAAADRPAMLAELPDAGFSADGVAAPSTAGFSYGACNGACVFDPAGAKALLADAGAAPRLVVGYVGEGQRGVANALARSLERGGFGATVEEVAAEDLPTRIEAGTVDVFSFGWAAPAGSLDAIIEPLFGSYSRLNVTRLVSPEIDELLAQAARTGDDQARWDILAQVEQIALNRWVLIPVAVAQNGLVQSPDIDPLPLRTDGSIDVDALE